MSRKDFQLIARTIRSYTMNEAERYNLAQHFAHSFASTNPRFDFARFIEACTK